MPPDPVGRRERSRARPPSAVGAGVLARAASGARPLRGLRTSGLPPLLGGRPAARAAHLRPSPAVGRASSRGLRQCSPAARRAPQASPDPLGPFGHAACLCTRRWLLAQLAALLLVVAAVEDVPFAAAGDHALRHAGTRELVEAAVEGEALGEPALRLGEEEPLVADTPELLTRDGLQEGVGQEREARLGERHSGNPRCCALRCFTSCSTRRRSRSSRRTPGAPLRTRRSASALASRSISASSSKLRLKIAAKRVRIVSSGAVGSSSWACTSCLTRLLATRSICAGDGPMVKT